MPVRTLSDAADAPAAVNAFLRGVERRGTAFAELQCGDAGHGDEAMVVAVRAFRSLARQVPIQEWPRRFWALLLAAPVFWQRLHAARWPSGLQLLGTLGHGPRAALLLRLVAGLSEADAAAVLGVSQPTYRFAVLRALPRQTDQQPDRTSWRALAEAARLAARSLPAERLTRLAAAREAALRSGNALLREGSAYARQRPRWWLPTLVAVGLACTIALTITFFSGNRGGPEDDRIHVRALPPVESTAATYDDDMALLTHPAFEMLLADAGPAARDPAFYAWLTAQADAQRQADEAQPLPLAEATMPAPKKPTAQSGHAR